MYDYIQERIADYEKEILCKLVENALSTLAPMEREECRGQEAPKLENKQKAKAIKKNGDEPMHQALYRISGADLVAIDAIGVETVQVVLSE